MHDLRPPACSAAVVAPLFSLFLAAPAACQERIRPPAAAAAAVPEPPIDGAALAARGRAWLTRNQLEDGSWGGTYSIAIASFAALAYLAGQDEPFAGDDAKPLVRALRFLLQHQKDGEFETQGHSWIHGQGFGTLALSEAFGRSRTCETEPDLDMDGVRDVVAKAVASIAKNQSTSGGWWYTPGQKHQHEGSTTCCAVQALVSAHNFGIAIDENVLALGFEYLKKCQNPDGGFDYKLGDTTSMKEGTAGGVATLGLMRKFDYAVMMNGYKFLLEIGPHAITRERFPYYGHFYGLMGMRLLEQELELDVFDAYVAGARKDLAEWQREDGSWPVHSWIASQHEPDAYATAFASLIFAIEAGRLSIFNRAP